MNIMKKIILSISVLLMTSQVAYGFPQPVIDFSERTLGPNEIIDTNSIDSQSASFKRMLGDDETNIFALPQLKFANIEKRINISNGNFNLLVLNLPIISEIKYHGIYIFSNNLTLGYCFLEPIYIDSYVNDPIIKNIKALTKNNNYLKNDLIIPPEQKLNFYEKQNGDFIERYAILKTPNRLVLIQDSFYPKSLDKQLNPYIIKDINTIMKYYHDNDGNINEAINDN